MTHNYFSFDKTENWKLKSENWMLKFTFTVCYVLKFKHWIHLVVCYVQADAVWNLWNFLILPLYFFTNPLLICKDEEPMINCEVTHTDLISRIDVKIHSYVSICNLIESIFLVLILIAKMKRRKNSNIFTCIHIHKKIHLWFYTILSSEHHLNWCEHKNEASYNLNYFITPPFSSPRWSA